MRPKLDDYRTTVGNTDLIQWGKYSMAQDEYIDYLENQLRKESIGYFDTRIRELEELVKEKNEEIKRLKDKQI